MSPSKRQIEEREARKREEGRKRWYVEIWDAV